jgi:DNA replication protein DnaC
MFKGISVEITPSDEKEVEEYWAKVEQDRKADALERYKASGVPAKFYEESFETFATDTDAMKVVKTRVIEFAEKPRNRILILCGENGNGKTHLASSVIRECGGVFVVSSMLCVQYDSATSFKAKRSREEILNYMSTCKMLVIDDCGKYPLNPELEKFLLSYIISARYSNNLPLVLTTNGKKEAFINFLGKAVYDRFTEVCTTVEFNWGSYRKSKRVQEGA